MFLQMFPIVVIGNMIDMKDYTKYNNEAKKKIDSIEIKILERMKWSFRRDRKLSVGENSTGVSKTESITRKKLEEDKNVNPAKNK